MENPIFRKKSLDRVSSPEELNDYIKVTSPGVWIVLAAVLFMIAGFIVWGVVGRLETKINSVAVSVQGTVVCYVRESEIDKVDKGDIVRIGEREYAVESISGEPIKAEVGEELSEYAMRVGGLSVGEWVYRVQFAGELPAGVYGASIVTGSVSPITFLFN